MKKRRYIELSKERKNIPLGQQKKKKPKVKKETDLIKIDGKTLRITVINPISEDSKQEIALCSSCKREFEKGLVFCPFCKEAIKKSPSIIDSKFVKCECGARNPISRDNCFICGQALLKEAAHKAESLPQFLVRVEFEGKVYSSIDENLPVDMRFIIERVEKNGYDRKIIEEWSRIQKFKTEFVKEKVRSQTQALGEDFRSRQNFTIFIALSIITAVILLFLSIFLNWKFFVKSL